MLRKKPVFIILFILLMTLGLGRPVSVLYAADEERDHDELPSVFVYESHISQTDTTGGLLFFISTGKLSNRHNGYIISFFSTIEVQGNFTGDIYAFFSDVRINSQVEYQGAVNIVSSGLIVEKGPGTGQIDIRGMGIFDWFSKSADTDAYWIYSNTVPWVVFQILLAIISVIIAMLLFLMKKSFMFQGSILLEKEPVHVIRNGIVVYSILIGFIILFALSVILIPLSLVLLMLIGFLIILGEVSLSLFLGYVLTYSLSRPEPEDREGKAMVKGFPPFVYLLIGVCIIETVKIIPVIGWVMGYVLLPVVTIGLGATAILNGFVFKVFYDVPYANDPLQKVFQKDKIRDMILRNH